MEIPPLKQFDQIVTTGFQATLGEIQRQLDQMHRTQVINIPHSRHVGGDIRQDKVHFVSAEQSHQFFKYRITAKITLNELNTLDGIHGQYVQCHDPALAIQNASAVLAPAARSGTQIDHAHAGPEQPVCLVQFFQLVNGARTIARCTRRFYEWVTFMFFQPPGTGFGSLWHQRFFKNLTRQSVNCWPVHPARFSTMSLTENQKKHLRRLAHPKHPIVMVGHASGEPGKMEAIIKELDGALDVHELVKVRARLDDRETRDAVFATLSNATRSEMVQRIGNIGVFYRANQEKPRVILPDA